MTKMNINAMKKFFVGAFAVATIALGANNCFACGCQESCVVEVQKVVVSNEIHEPACAAELPYQLGTAVRYEQNGDTSVLTIMGNKEEVLPEYVGAKRHAIREGKLVFVEEYHDIDTNFTSVKLVMKDDLVFYPGFVKSKQIEGDFDKVTEKIVENGEQGYKIVDFEGYGFFYEGGSKAKAELAKKF